MLGESSQGTRRRTKRKFLQNGRELLFSVHSLRTFLRLLLEKKLTTQYGVYSLRYNIHYFSQGRVTANCNSAYKSDLQQCIQTVQGAVLNNYNNMLPSIRAQTHTVQACQSLRGGTDGRTQYLFSSTMPSFLQRNHSRKLTRSLTFVTAA